MTTKQYRDFVRAQYPKLFDDVLRFAIIGDYGTTDVSGSSLASVVKAFDPDYVFTVGDNCDGIGPYTNVALKYYSKWLSKTLADTKFYPTPGPADYDFDNLDPYLNFFALPDNGGCCRYYHVTLGPVQFFCMNSNTEEPDGVDAASVQALWLKTAAAVSVVPFKVGLMAHSPYSSSVNQEGDTGERRGSVFALQWGDGAGLPYENLTFHVSGHNRQYERLAVGGLTYLVGGTGCVEGDLEAFGSTSAGSLVRIADERGFIAGEANWGRIRLSFIDLDGVVRDEVTRTYDG